MSSEIKVGDTYYVFNINRRVYEKSGDSLWRGQPIYREHFEPTKVIGETSRSWLCEPDWKPIKVQKNDPWKVLHTQEMVNEKVWVHVHANRIGDAVKTASIHELRKIADFIGYKGGDT